MKYVIRPYKLGSTSAKALAEKLRCKRVKEDYVPRRDEVVINWGNPRTNMLLKTSSDFNVFGVGLAISKNLSYAALDDVGPPWTTFKDVAEEWGTDVVVRHILNGHGGAGIEIVEKGNPLPDAPLYTQYFKRKKEFRVHVFKGKIIDLVEKRKPVNRPDGLNNKIRNHANGWVFCREDVVVPEVVKDYSIKAVERLALDFGAVDVGWNEKYDKACVFEVNTAPGLEGTTLEKYAEAFKEYLGGLQ